MRLGLGHGLDIGYRSELFGATSYLLDTYTGAAAAYSLRQLRTGVTSVVRVRRSSDDAEADFTAAEVTDGTLTTWTGANDGFVVTLYDQSVNGKNFTQATAGSQPKIVDAGTLVTLNGLPAIEADGTDDWMRTSLMDSITAHHFFLVCSKDVTGDAQNIILDGYDSAYPVYIGNTSSASQFMAIDANGTEIFINSDWTGQRLLTVLISDGENHGYEDGALKYSNTDTGTRASTGLTLFNIRNNVAANYNWGGKFQELIYYGESKSANRADIETAINSHYSIY